MIRMGQGKLTESLYRSSLETLKTAAKDSEGPPVLYPTKTGNWSNHDGGNNGI